MSPGLAAWDRGKVHKVAVPLVVQAAKEDRVGTAMEPPEVEAPEAMVEAARVVELAPVEAASVVVAAA